MSSVVSVVSDPVFRTYYACSSALALKMMFMSVYTGYWRIKTKTFVNPEDAANLKGDLKGQVRTDERVERVRRAHLNDLENIPLFFVSAYIFSLTGPTETVAKSLFYTYTGARIVHTLVYSVVVVPQPARGLAFGVGLAITGYMAVKGLLYFL